MNCSTNPQQANCENEKECACTECAQAGEEAAEKRGEEGCCCASTNEAASESDKIAALEREKQLLEGKVTEHYDLYVRAMAELENTRRRSSEEIQKALKFGVEKFAENLLPVVDSLEKALELSKDEEKNPMREGMLATYRQLVHALDMSGMKEINPEGEAFNPHQHQAINMVPATEEFPAGHVAKVFQRGWMIHDRVLRPAMVSVSQGK